MTISPVNSTFGTISHFGRFFGNLWGNIEKYFALIVTKKFVPITFKSIFKIVLSVI